MYLFWLFWSSQCNLNFVNEIGNVIYNHNNISAVLLNETVFDTLETNCSTEIMEDFFLHTQHTCINEITNQQNYCSNNSFCISLPDAWNLDMIDSNIDNKYSFPMINNNIDNNVSIFILDTGVNKNHIEFEKDQVVSLSSFNPVNSHGTGTSSCASGKRYGSSKNITIYDYAVCRYGGSCASSDVVLGLELVLNYTKQNWNKTSKTGKRTVINMSLGSFGGVNISLTSFAIFLDGLFKEIIDNGGIIVVAAGNSNQDACTWFYSFSPYVISVGSLDKFYNKSSFSNYGDCVDVWMFGSNVLAAYSVINNITIQYKSGTSFSSPLIAGIIANLLIENINYTKEEILNILKNSYSCNSCCKSKKSKGNSRQNIYCKNLNRLECISERMQKICEIDSC